MSILPQLESQAFRTSVDREHVAEILDFPEVTRNSLDSVSDRDFALEFLSASSILMMHLSRFSEELILWSTSEFKFIDLSDGFCTGSSIMPQKKNPDVPELVRGKTGRVYGNLISLLTLMKSLPLAYNKDMQEDKEPLFDTIDTVRGSLKVFAAMIAQMTVNAANMRQAAARGFSTATDVADYLVRKGLPFRQAHEVVGKTEPPPAVSRFTVVEQPNGGRAFFWDMVAPLDLSGFLLRYSEGTTVRPWDSMVPLLEAGKEERSRVISSPGDGEFWLAIKAVDTSGNVSSSATYLQAIFDAAGFGAFLTVDPAALGWPGTKSSAAIDGYVLVDIGVSSWDTLPLTWDAWTAWTTGSSGSISYEHPVIDATTSASTRIRVSEVAGGTAVSEYQSSVDGVTYTAWAAVPAGPVTARYFKVRWTVSGAAPILYRASVTLYR